jgi:NAD(P)H-dependent FMN reductase
MSERAFLFLLSSTRRDSNSEALARLAAATLPADVPQRWLRLDEHPLPAFVDLRHDGGFPAADDAARPLIDATLAATDLVFVTPVYWYSLPAAAKLYLDHWSAWMRDPALDFVARMKGRRLWAVVVDSSEHAETAFAPLVDTLVRTADYMDMRWMGALHGHGNRPGDPAVAAAPAEIAAYFAAP